MEDGELEQSDDELSIVYLSEGLQGETSTTVRYVFLNSFILNHSNLDFNYWKWSSTY